MTETDDSTDTERPTVLIVEDEPDLAELFSLWLSPTYSVEMAGDGEAAMAALGPHADVVVLDRRLPGRSGDELISRIREQADESSVVIVSAVVPDPSVIDLDCDAYLTKPVDETELRDTVARMVALASLEEPRREIYRLAAIKTSLEARYRPAQLRTYPEYRALLERLPALEADVDEAGTGELPSALEAVLRDLDAEPTKRGRRDVES